MSFTNLYYKRAAGTSKACYICNRPTTTVLATKDSVDFLYTCETHLKDPGFASPLGESGDGAGGGARKLGLSDEEIQKVKEEWEERQRRKKEKEKEDNLKKDEREEGKDAEKGDEKDKKEMKSVTMPGALASTPSTPSPVPHQRYALHREIFAMRLTIHRKRRQAAQAKEVAPRLPSAPRAPVNPSIGQ